MKAFAPPFLALLAALAGCSSSSTGTSAVIHRAADFTCDQLLLCDNGNAAYDRATVASAAECRALVQSALLADFGEQAFINAGTAKIDGAALNACTDAIAADPCVSPRDIPACRNVIAGRLPGGAACRTDVECMSGACTASAGTCGTCLAPAALGAACDLNNDNCLPSNDGFVSCQPSPAGGGVCVLETASYLTVGLNQNCDNNGGVDRYCASPYYCDTNGLCAERIAAGMPCDPSFDDCAFGTVCDDAGNGDVCLPIVEVTAANQPCGVIDATAQFGRCDRSKRLYCDQNGGGTGVCMALAGTGAVNSDCLATSDCDAGLVCTADGIGEGPGSCRTTGNALGVRCDVDAECTSVYCRYSPAAGNSICQDPACP